MRGVGITTAAGTMIDVLPLVGMSASLQADKRTRADAHFKAREILRADADQARRDYYAAQAAIRERTERLRNERLLRQAQQSGGNGRAGARK